MNHGFPQTGLVQGAKHLASANNERSANFENIAFYVSAGS